MSQREAPTELFHRHENNPILTVKDWPYPANSVFNAGAIRFNSKTLLLARVEDLRGMSHLTVATSNDGFTEWQIDSQPTLTSELNSSTETWGLEDPRIVYLEREGLYAVCYTGYSQGGPLVCLVTTKDFKRFERHGAILPPDNKDASIFPRKIGEHYMLIHRPAVHGQPAHMWLAKSPDLLHWGQHQLLMQARHGWWDSAKIGLGPQPIETAEGWLIIYHGVRVTASGSIYRIGLALLDLDEPSRVISRSKQWVFGPSAEYERIGDVRDANFPCGAIVDESRDELRLYYGAADTSMAVASAKVSELLDFLKQENE